MAACWSWDPSVFVFASPTPCAAAQVLIAETSTEIFIQKGRAAKLTHALAFGRAAESALSSGAALRQN
jgi:hypothetical protein